MKHQRLQSAFLWSLCILLAGCEAQADRELRAWMEQTRHQSYAKPEALPPPASSTGFRYEAAGRADPFEFQKITVGLNADIKAGEGIQPDLARQREALESFPLDSLRMVGSLRSAGDVVALIEAEKTIYQLRLGGHLGQDLGKVVSITDSGVEIDELLQDSSGRWNKRRSQLKLQEKR